MNAMPRYLKLRTAVACSLLATSVSSFAAVSSSAETQEDYRSRVVKFGDLDLRHGEDAAVLYARIRSAARAVCYPPYNSLVLQRSISDQCRDQTIARAVSDVNAPALTTYYTERTRASVAKR
jgi:UrcA family protein